MNRPKSSRPFTGLWFFLGLLAVVVATAVIIAFLSGAITKNYWEFR